MDFGIQPVDAYTGFSSTGAFQDAQVRRAFAYCIDRQAIVDAVYFGLTGIPNAYISNSHPYFPSDATTYPYDPAQGRTLLDAAGWVDTNGNGIRDKDGVEFSLYLITTDAATRITIVGLIASQMLTNCGIEVIPDHRPAGEVFSDGPYGPIFGRKFDLAEFAWLTGYEPPCDLYLTDNIPSEENGWGQSNVTGYGNPLYDEACQAALSSVTEMDKAAHHGDAVRIFTQDLPVLPLHFRLLTGAAAPNIEGFTLDPTGGRLWNLEGIWVSLFDLYLPIALKH